MRSTINEIYFVCDLDCNFVTNSLSGGTAFGLLCELAIQNLMSSSENPLTMSQKIISYQISMIENTKSISDLIVEKKIKIQGIISSRKENKLTLIAQ